MREDTGVIVLQSNVRKNFHTVKIHQMNGYNFFPTAEDLCSLRNIFLLFFYNIM